MHEYFVEGGAWAAESTIAMCLPPCWPFPSVSTQCRIVESWSTSIVLVKSPLLTVMIRGARLVFFLWPRQGFVNT